ncbi:hypothetical protein RIF29_28584 [Crotalaria pallida]|uniref:BHLH domain-containing protein n=1 Tax=Crotalaria pallida TaxID=3830 RepID=A0AAN9EI73_CROPI
MEETWESWHVHTEMDHDEEFLDKCHTNDEEFLREILLQEPTFSCNESEIDHSHLHNNYSTAHGGVIVPSEEMAHMVKSNSSNSIENQQHGDGGTKRPRNSSTPRTYILSFDDSTMIPLTPEPQNNYEKLLGNEGTTRSSNPALPSNKRSQDPEPRPKLNNQGGAKRGRNSSQSMDHIMAERKRRQELTERFIALSATIPGLNKTDKASILRAAIDYVKQLQERVQDLEKEHKNSSGADSVVVIKRSDLCANEDSTSSEASSEGCCTLPEIEARVLGTDILIEIHCEKENGIELKILDHLENLQLWVTGSSVLPFGNSTLGITIIAQMGKAFKIAVNDLVKNLRQVILKSCDGDPY